MPAEAFHVKGKKILLLNPDKPYGREAARGLLSEGAELWLCAGEPGALAAAGEELGVGAERRYPYTPGTEEAAGRLAAWAEANMGAPDAVVVVNPGSRLETWTPEFDELNASLFSAQTGLMLTVKRLGLLLAKAGRGSVLFLTDFGALVGYDPWNYEGDPALFARDFVLDRGFIAGSYVNYARQAAGFLGEHGVRCNALAFGPLPEPGHPGFGEAVVRHSHLKRLLSAEDIKNAVCFMVSDASRFITGVTLPVDGGYTAK